MINSKIYLPNLNSIRAIAAFMVIISHIERKMSFFNLPVCVPFTKLGNIGVTLFFSLSGFLITYLLLLEKEKFNKINVKDFYIRRSLRIWPLYFLVLLFVYLLVPFLLPDYYASEIERFSLKSVLLNVFFLTNITIVLKYTPLIMSVIWSIGIEEQFYLFWPWVVKSKNMYKLIILIILIIPIIKIVCLFLIGYSGNFKIIYEILSHTRFDSMAIGGLFGIIAYKKELIIKTLKLRDTHFKNKLFQFVLYLITFFLLIFSLHNNFVFNLYNYQILPILFSIIILNLIDSKTSILSLENKIMNYLGKISYSLYLLHVLAFYFLFPYIKGVLNINNSFTTIFIIYFIAIVTSIVIAILSYELFEKRFLKYKKSFSHIKT